MMKNKEIRIALTVENFDQAVEFYREGLGLEPGEIWTDNGNGQIFWAGKAGLEIFDTDYAAGIDRIEAGRRVSGQIRFAFEVEDLESALERALAHGGTLAHPPVLTPWGDRSARVQAPDGLQITLFQPKSKN